ncbi:hypothetical protein [Halobacterium sp. KA-6]|uniref:hypothetical protein n=1 Tax=Halobacterium sp. KA-6 TaxID=2896368 RepID=UPI001E40DED3|nr:hypothetical protein [Halobacterium sp. KA-6]MCD2204657.1 hypothetical protein [Halobacterium sp. KA-6]
MTQPTPHRPLEAYSLQAVAKTTALLVVGNLAALAAVSEPATAATVAMTILAVLGGQRALAVWRTYKDTATPQTSVHRPRQPGPSD